MVKLTVDGHVVVLMVMLAVMVLVQEGRANCLNNAYFSVCPSPFYYDTRPGKNNSVNISCHTGNFSSFTSMQLGTQGRRGFMAVAGLSPGQPPEVYQPSQSRLVYTPRSRYTVTAEGNSLTLTLEECCRDFYRVPWKCVVRDASSTGIYSRSHTVPIQIRRHPGNISLEVIPDKDVYNASDIVELRCTTILDFGTYEDELDLGYYFQYFYQGQWTFLNISDHSLVHFIHFVMPGGDESNPYIPYGIGVRVQTFVGGRGRIRCYVSIGTRDFVEEAAERVMCESADQCLSPKSAEQADQILSFIAGIVVTLLLAVVVTIFMLIRWKKAAKDKNSQEGFEASIAVGAPGAAFAGSQNEVSPQSAQSQSESAGDSFFAESSSRVNPSSVSELSSFQEK